MLLLTSYSSRLDRNGNRYHVGAVQRVGEVTLFHLDSPSNLELAAREAFGSWEAKRRNSFFVKHEGLSKKELPKTDNYLNQQEIIDLIRSELNYFETNDAAKVDCMHANAVEFNENGSVFIETK